MRPFLATITKKNLAGEGSGGAAAALLGWEIRFRPVFFAHGHHYCPALELVFLGEPRASVTAALSARMTAGSCRGSHYYDDDDFVAFNEITTAPMEFRRPLDRFPPLYIGVGRATESLGEFDTCSWAVECNITVFRDPPAAGGEGAVAVPSFNLT